MVFCVFIFIFCLEPTLGKDTWMRASSATVMVFFSKLPFWKLLDHNYVQTSCSRIARHIEKSILQEIPQLKILWTWIKLCANTFIKTWANIMKRKSTKVPWKLSLTKKHDPARQRTFYQSRWYFIYYYKLLFLSNKPSF